MALSFTYAYFTTPIMRRVIDVKEFIKDCGMAVLAGFWMVIMSPINLVIGMKSKIFK